MSDPKKEREGRGEKDEDGIIKDMEFYLQEEAWRIS